MAALKRAHKRTALGQWVIEPPRGDIAVGQRTLMIGRNTVYSVACVY